MNKAIPLVLTNLLLVTACTGQVPKLGVVNGQLLPCPEKQNCVNSQATEGQYSIAPLLTKNTPVEAQAKLIDLIKKAPNTTIKTNTNDYILVEYTSKVFRFVDDVEFYIPANQGEFTTIHVRSASRLGESDFGVNRKRIEDIRAGM